MKCCSICFGDRHLSRTVFSKNDTDTDIGTCPYCGATEQNLVEPKLLRDYFEILNGCYIRDDEGVPIIEWYKDDWELFLHSNMGNENEIKLISDILNDENIARQKFVPLGVDPDEVLKRWETFRKELKHENRFFPTTAIDSDRLEELLVFLPIEQDERPKSWYRARIQKGNTSYIANEMGAPPKETASHGRANPAGIPYLYLASDTGTSISEIRPHTGELVTVAEIMIPDDLKIVDLRDPRHTVSPFMIADEEEIVLLRSDLRYLQHLGMELTRPVLPSAVAIDYIPTQYLCEFIKKCGYDGVMYRSSVGTGVNMALFDPDSCVVGKLTTHCVSCVSVESELIAP